MIEQVVFNNFQAIKYPKETNDYFEVDVIQGAVDEVRDKSL